MPGGGYAWWYIDALSDDGRHGITLIAFIGSVFSPFYARARRLAANRMANPLHFCAMNVALYGEGGKRWAFTERSQANVARDTRSLSIGPNVLFWDGNTLTVDFDELSAPLPRRVKGTIRLRPAALPNRYAVLHRAGGHQWWPIAPCASVEVDLSHPVLRWSGAGYLDSNRGDTPLEAAFRGWTWSRAATRDGTAVLYDVAARSGDAPQPSLALEFGATGTVRSFDAPPVAPLPATHWRIARSIRSDERRQASIVRTLEDTPFYARSIVSTRLLGQDLIAFHESLSLERFNTRWVQALLPFRIRRAR